MSNEKPTPDNQNSEGETPPEEQSFIDTVLDHLDRIGAGLQKAADASQNLAEKAAENNEPRETHRGFWNEAPRSSSLPWWIYGPDADNEHSPPSHEDD
ncbi:hypothetical protein [Thioalkalivibrio sp. ALgr3]|uniref:hypothetical protein n=1 Tax=Thioalkalivibrio sp. ALgr3 TaxID=1239292 RepID=UPI00036DB58B|nr:hypothetical protein [Thioalkalivibrio sp. ALgr3]